MTGPNTTPAPPGYNGSGTTPIGGTPPSIPNSPIRPTSQQLQQLGLPDWMSNIDWGSLVSFISGLGQRAVEGIGDHAGDIALSGLAAWQASNAADASRRSGDLSQHAIDTATQRYTAAQPMRDLASQRLLSPTQRNLSSVYADENNPFSRARARSAPPVTPPPSVPNGPPTTPPVVPPGTVPGGPITPPILTPTQPTPTPIDTNPPGQIPLGPGPNTPPTTPPPTPGGPLTPSQPTLPIGPGAPPVPNAPSNPDPTPITPPDTDGLGGQITRLGFLAPNLRALGMG